MDVIDLLILYCRFQPYERGLEGDFVRFTPVRHALHGPNCRVWFWVILECQQSDLGVRQDKLNLSLKPRTFNPFAA